MSESIHDRAHGKWKGILPSLGVPTNLLSGKHQPCPFCGGRDRFRFADYRGSGGYICSQCGNGTGVDLLMRLKGWDFKTAAREIEKVVGSCKQEAKREPDKEAHRAAMNRLWRSSKAVCSGDVVSRYLTNRCAVKDVPPCLRFVNALFHRESGRKLPAMLAKVTGPDGRGAQLHRTWLSEHGRKADVEPVRALMPGEWTKGSAVRLAATAETLGIAEGIETALSATALTGVPCWAALTAGFLEKWEAPAEAKHIVIFADNDASFTGQAAAYALAKRLRNSGRDVDIRVPEREGDDWNDVHRGRRAA